MVLNNPLLAGLIGKYNAAEITTAAAMAVGLPVPLITRYAEVTEITNWLAHHRQ